uniref:Sulfotransferase n=1 Tax=Chlamydomonas leiostraca TaxID=1034604 RepID=A0A7S0RXH7_9CHLO|mmetsp:Transcript_34214/g.86553  ORF Transcript_34214/g.86553 Transcript_34214/m.86553 type:complete len:452 (+) Transcript_34214:3-1358(+)
MFSARLVPFSCLLVIGASWIASAQITPDAAAEAKALAVLTRFNNATRIPGYANHCWSVDGRDYCVPAVIIAGMGKSGTSALYELLARRPDTERFNRQYKEWCPTAASYSAVLAFLARPRPSSAGALLASGCIASLWENGPLREVLTNTTARTHWVLMVRDYPDWVYSSFTFWCLPGWDADCSRARYGWHNASDTARQRPRNPDTFHAAVASGRFGVDYMQGQRPFKMRAAAERLAWSVRDPSLIHIINHADLWAEPQAVLTQVEGWLGLTHHIYPERLLGTAYNTWRTRGAGASTQKRRYTPLTPMYCDTYRLLAKAWAPDCGWMRRKHGVKFRSCDERTAAVRAVGSQTGGGGASRAMQSDSSVHDAQDLPLEHSLVHHRLSKQVLLWAASSKGAVSAGQFSEIVQSGAGAGAGRRGVQGGGAAGGSEQRAEPPVCVELSGRTAAAGTAT